MPEPQDDPPLHIELDLDPNAYPWCDLCGKPASFVSIGPTAPRAFCQRCMPRVQDAARQNGVEIDIFGPKRRRRERWWDTPPQAGPNGSRLPEE